jgi:DNA topoisomerase I
VLTRIKALVIPPAWEDVWICPDPRGHIQAVGTDAAGRRQYRYHDLWREQRDRRKHDRMLEVGAALPGISRAIRRHLDDRGLSRDRVLAAAVSLTDLGFFRPGGRGWHDVTAADLNDYLREVSGGGEFTVKDFRTWHATVLAAVGLAVSRTAAATPAARKRAVARVVREVADYLGDTPAVARASYIDPRVTDRYEHGMTIVSVLGDLGASSDFGQLATEGRAEAAVLRLLAG